MTKITLRGTPANTYGPLPSVGNAAPNFSLVKGDLSEVSLSDFAGKKLILNIFPSVDTGTCAKSVRSFNERAASIENAAVLCISADLPFAFNRFCGAEGIKNVTTLSSFRDSQAFAKEYGTLMIDGPMKGLHARAIVVIGEDGLVRYNQLVHDIVDEPDYDAAVEAL